ncbi:hypothetical protein PYW08_004604 [Mythimna loreyi]|uniref:Uncharacterized protein n=1 Tax=Mythimna loreyi TaxID=667449 RepID=A0ACC2QPD8_9NEOP|nr:hypothetical protein PYW08_004604 [Mythimna loreyi]
MSEDEVVDIEKELTDLLTKVQPNLQDVIKRSFTNVALQQTKNGEQIKADSLGDTSYFAKNTQVNLSRLELVKPPTFHLQALALDLNTMSLTLRCSLGEVNVKGLYSAFNENLYNLIPVLAEGHVIISLSNMIADVRVGLMLEDDAYSIINPDIEFTHDEVLVKLSWPSPQKNGGYDFATTEQLAKHIDDLPLTAAVSLPLYALLREKLQRHLALVLRQATSVSEVMCCNPSLMEAYREAPATSSAGAAASDQHVRGHVLQPIAHGGFQLCERSSSVSEVMCCNPSLMEAYSGMIDKLSEDANKVVDMVLINMRRTLLQSCCEVLQLPPLHATFMHKVGSISFIGKFETDTGWVKNLATINRISDVSVTRPHPFRTCFYVTLRIKDLQIGYDEYRIRAMGVSSGGRATAALQRHSLLLAFSVGLAHWEPYAHIDHLRVQNLDCSDLHVTGLGPLSGAAGLVSAWLRGAAGALAAPALLQQLQADLQTALQELPLCELVYARYFTKQDA